ncbi:ABC transporter permease [Aquamicrobium defluvii]|uniref:ABC transporter permease n=1 Tax=Aquamicrobium defluvii TaxID=69279 RepID=A0A011UFM0_9HYPH|nr:ABC transporter permease [Aquamicrobium defluvii]EXL04936.1 ABC transporter permease [Aquamicrobium defluvii]EZQ14565.1 ABC transporter permease [Halopseudomonas bauzanensis]
MAQFWRGFTNNRAAVLGLAILIVIVMFGALAPILYPGDPFRRVGTAFQPPLGNFFFGTDVLGRDVGAQLAHGVRISLMIGFAATGLAVLLATAIGGIAGYYGGWTDEILMRITEFFQTIPSFLFAILLIAILSPSIWSIVLAIGVVTWPPITRLVRGEFKAMRNREFVQACVALGMRDLPIMFREILPNCLSPILVIASLSIASAILIESALAFLGLGDPNVISWGYMVGVGRPYLRTAWWLCAVPGMAILLTVLAINLVGEGLNDALNPRLRNQR